MREPFRRARMARVNDVEAPGFKVFLFDQTKINDFLDDAWFQSGCEFEKPSK